jgi:RNA-directed DNA polymerase
MSDKSTLALALASALLDGDWSPRSISRQARKVLGSRPKWLRKILRRIGEQFPLAPLGGRDELAAALLRSGLSSHDDEYRPISPRRYSLEPTRMGSRRWPVPRLSTVGDLAGFLEVDLSLLERLADRKGLGRIVRDEPLRNYRYRWFPKKSGGCRLLEVPKPRLRAAQRKVLHGILDHIPPHALAHGFAPGRNLLGFVRPHCGRALLLRLDLESFFSSVTSGRVFGIFRTAGYSEEVARTLTAICTNRTPAAFLAAAPPELARSPEERWRTLKKLEAPHLPQGAPTSPALANLTAYRMDVRLAAAAADAGALYTRYADDLAFSFDEEAARRASRFHLLAAGIALDEGFSLQFRKTRFVRRGTAQRLGGLTINEHPNVPRREVDLLRATLHRAAREGPAGFDRAQLRGRIAWVAQANPSRSKKLRALFDQIAWD